MFATIQRLIDQDAKLVIPAANLTSRANLYDLGLTSFDAIRLLVAVERAFTIEFQREMLNRESAASIATIVKAVQAMQQSPTAEMRKAAYPDRVALRSERYAIPNGKSPADVKAELQSALASELAARKFSYTRSDGSAWTLSLKDVIDRAEDLEMGYNPNDCVELRWGAPDGSAEAATCRRRAPAAQRAKMTDYRTWFRERYWPHA
jgi:acyl carrier protein